MGSKGESPRSDGVGFRLTRRGLLAGASAVAGAHLLGGSQGHSVSAVEGPAGFQAGAVASGHAVRGAQVQIKPPPPPPINWRPGHFITHVDVATRRMALTFDDGPSPYNTPSVLRTLASYGIKATFFLVGVNVRSFPSIARAIAEEGHELGNHSIYHTPYQSTALANQIGGNQAIIRDTTGITPVVHRAPGLTRGYSILNTCASYGIYEAHTHMSTFDYLSPRRSAWQLTDEFVRYHRNGAMPIYHDGGNRRPTPDALPSIINYGLSIGYTFVTATELVNSGAPRPARFGYALTAEPTTDSVADDAAEGYVDRCKYDAEAELIAMLDSGDVSLNSQDRSRIVEVLADIETAKQD
ncbi:MAG: polysaccharide deacetylase family protein [Actinobacteria bacterium]|nr:polysaccharide deacetylase family protein [Actinomycetota bacterium]